MTTQIFTNVPMLGDGSCVFRSISYVLYGDQSRHAEVRNAVVEYILNNWDTYKYYLVKDNKRSYIDKNEYANEMSKPTTYSTSTEFKLAADLYKLNFIIYKIDESDDMKLIYQFGNPLYPIKYFKFSGDLDNGHVDVMNPLVTTHQCLHNTFVIKLTYVKYLCALFKKMPEVRVDTISKCSETVNAYNEQDSSDLNVKLKSINEILLTMHEEYNDMIIMDNEYVDRIVEKRDETDSDVESLVEIKKDTTALNLLNVNKKYRYTNKARVYVKITNINAAKFVIDIELLLIFVTFSIKSDNSDFVSNDEFIDNLKKSVENNYKIEENLTVIFFAEDVFYNNFLRKFILNFSDVSRHEPIPPDVVDELQNLKDDLNSLDLQFVSVKAAIATLFCKMSDDQICCYNVILCVNQREYDALVDERVKAVLEIYNNFVAIEFFDMEISFNDKRSDDNIMNLAETYNDNMLVDTILPNYGMKRSAVSVESISNKNRRIKMAKTSARSLQNIASAYNKINVNATITTDEENDEEEKENRRRTDWRRFRQTRADKKRFTSRDNLSSTATAASPELNITTAKRTEPSLPTIEIPLPQTMPAYLINIVVNIPLEVDLAYISCPTNSLSTAPELIDYKKTLDKIKQINLAPLNGFVYFYEMLLPLSYYGGDSLNESQAIWFISKSNAYFTMCVEKYDRIIKHFETEPDRNRIFVFVIKYNFLWHYRNFIRSLKHEALTAFHNQKIINTLYIYDKTVQSKFDSLHLKFPIVTDAPYHISKIIKLMMAQTF
ncbi:vp80 [Artaxa digramma nucleopolyhedrovirus]|uniref:Vp80 n=1 Tax=Artaxa digramma nucleopolyhedrovirus TaxID=3070910 RepID=A0AAE6R6Y9_9ABAC|nr:vp80 [Euproctis digramma nucleopolyhedrovirus]QHB21754.1 vp80 [Artaxa digramma nucleopolyhedrovirus]